MKRIILAIIVVLSAISGCGKQKTPIQPIAIDYLTASGVPAPLGTIKVSVMMKYGLNAGLTYTWTVSNGWAITNGGNTQTATILAALAYSATGTATVTVSYTGHPDLFTTGTIALNTQGQSGPVTLAYNAPWPKFMHDMRSTGLSTADTSTDTGVLKWMFTEVCDSVYCLFSSPAIGADGTIYVISLPNGNLYAINSDGTLKWIYDNQIVLVINSSMAIGTDGTIYVGALDGNLYAFNPNGTLKWKYKTGYYVDSSPAIGADGTIYVGSEDDYLYAINPNGTLKWKYKTGYYVDSSPAIGADGTIYVGSDDGNLYAINPNGTLKWKYQTWGSIGISIAIDADGTIYVIVSDKFIYAINPNGTIKWTHYVVNDIDVFSMAIGADGTIYVEGSNLYAFNPKGTLKWSYPTGINFNSSPAIGADGTIYVGSGDGNLYAIH